MDEDPDALGCLICGERVYLSAPLPKQGPVLSPALVALIRQRWGIRDRRPIAVVQLARACSDLVGTEISEAAIRHVLTGRTWRDRAGAWLAVLPALRVLGDIDQELLTIGAALVDLVG